jgi:putative flippase GtrA
VRAKEHILHGTHRESVVGQMLRYGMVAVSGYVLAIVCYAGELDFGVSPYPALGVAFVLNGLFNFALIRVWAFPPSGRSVCSDLVRFCAVAAVSFVVNYSSFAVLYSAIGLRAVTAQRIAILIAAPVTFVANRLWSFRSRASGGGSATIVRETRGRSRLRSARALWRR